MSLRLWIALACLPSFALQADTIVFKNGEALEGKIVEQSETALVLQVEYGTLKIAKEKILRIEVDTPEKIAAREAAAEFKRKFEAEMVAQGKVHYKGKWVTEKEKAADEAKIAEEKRKKKDKEVAEAKRKAEAQAKADAEADRQAVAQAAAAAQAALQNPRERRHLAHDQNAVRKPSSNTRSRRPSRDDVDDFDNDD